VQRIVKFRQGFESFLDFCEASGIDFTVCSGGIDFFVNPVLAPYRERIKKMYTIPADLSGPMIRLRHTMTCGSCGLCKAMAMEEHPRSFKILIGDSLTDLHGAERADLVFARAKLKEILTQQGKPFEPYETFDEIRETLGRKYPDVIAASHAKRS
jgi:2-hydroxy-3-keto-5-methylthiopentenyl-1-phosphate phosphatase